jgi:hypothetical protein
VGREGPAAVIHERERFGREFDARYRIGTVVSPIAPDDGSTRAPTVTARELRTANGSARRLRRGDEVAPDMITMEIVVCDTCGARFGVGHRVTAHDPALAVRQAAWLREQFTWDHIRETKHPGAIPLPAACDIELAREHSTEKR